jgi:hypothetical protein
MSNDNTVERKSSAITCSDMELFIFPELLYSLALANIMSPCVWEWRQDPWFKDIDAMNFNKRIQRLKQFMMDKYIFNLDLETWGLTTKERELGRFKDFIDMNVLKQSNALFGYEGDKYYFDIDIRRHFGLDNYTNDVIPYWKTETVEAMNAFRFKDNYTTGAGECVSLSTLYAAALFIICKVPLKDIFLLATPLHSQNFVTINDGILTNNRRILTKSMWVNGSEISAKARRALENERITIVSHESGLIHTMYPDATIDPEAYTDLCRKLRDFTTNDITPQLLSNFVRFRRDIQKCFQVKWHMHGHDHYIESERVFSYELHSPHSFTAQTRKNLMTEIDEDSFHARPLPSRIVLNELEEYITTHKISFSDQESIKKLRAQFSGDCLSADIALQNLLDFCKVEPRLPDVTGKTFGSCGAPLNITTEMSREEIITRLETVRHENLTADLAFYAYRDLSRTEPGPFIKAAIERNPVSLEGLKGKNLDGVIEIIDALPNESIYAEVGRLAQPDEVWNFKRGDGIEKALLLANYLRAHTPGGTMNHGVPQINIQIKGSQALLSTKDIKKSFTTSKRLKDQVWDI